MHVAPISRLKWSSAESMHRTSVIPLSIFTDSFELGFSGVVGDIDARAQPFEEELLKLSSAATSDGTSHQMDLDDFTENRSSLFPRISTHSAGSSIPFPGSGPERVERNRQMRTGVVCGAKRRDAFETSSVHPGSLTGEVPKISAT